MNRPTSLLLLALILLPSFIACGDSSGTAQGSERGTCYPNDTCNTGLVCLSDVCVKPGNGADAALGTIDSGTAETVDAAAMVCNTTMDLGLAILNECVDQNCCASFDPCFADAACRACFEGQGTGCESNALLAVADECITTNCPTQFCESPLGSVAGATPFACNQCLDENCCTPLAECLAGGVEPCVACLDDSSSAVCASASGGVQQGATDFTTCQESICSSACAE